VELTPYILLCICGNKRINKILECCFVSLSDFYYDCINTINCTGQNMSESLLIARGEADAKMYLCSLRPGENVLLLRFIIIKFLYQLIGYCASMLGS